MGRRKPNHHTAQKKSRPIDRENNATIFLLRCVQMGLSVSDLKLLSIGMVLDMMNEADNDHQEYRQLATQDDFNAFKGKV